MRNACLAIGLFVLSCSPAFARDLYVNNVSGEDRMDGTTEVATSASTGPVRTLRMALRLANKYDRIIVANTGEPYRESVTLAGRHSGIPGALFTIVGNGAVLDGSAPIPENAWEFYRGEVFRFQPQRMPSQMVFFEGKPLPRGGQPGKDGLIAPLQPLEWAYVEGYIYFRPEAGRLPHQYNLTIATETVGITLYQLRGVVIQDLVVQGYQLDGINAHDSAFDVRLVGITSRGNGRSGFSIGGSSSVVLEACLAAANGEAQLRAEGYSHVRLVNTTLVAGAAPAIVKEDHAKVTEETVE